MTNPHFTSRPCHSYCKSVMVLKDRIKLNETFTLSNNSTWLKVSAQLLPELTEKPIVAKVPNLIFHQAYVCSPTSSSEILTSSNFHALYKAHEAERLPVTLLHANYFSRQTVELFCLFFPFCFYRYLKREWIRIR